MTHSAAGKENYTDVDCFVGVVLTHGDDGNFIYATDGLMRTTDVTEPFKGDLCPSLAGKPKIFIIQVNGKRGK